MPHSLYISHPMPVPRMFDEWATNSPYRRPMRIDLDNPQPIVDRISSMHNMLMENNIRLEAVMLGSIEYFSVQQFCVERSFVCTNNGEMELYGLRIILDPTRDRGPHVPIFKSDEGLKILSARLGG